MLMEYYYISCDVYRALKHTVCHLRYIKRILIVIQNNTKRPQHNHQEALTSIFNIITEYPLFLYSFGRVENGIELSAANANTIACNIKHNVRTFMLAIFRH